MSEYFEFFISRGVGFGFLVGFTAFFLGRGLYYGLSLFSDSVS